MVEYVFLLYIQTFNKDFGKVLSNKLSMTTLYKGREKIINSCGIFKLKQEIELRGGKWICFCVQTEKFKPISTFAKQLDKGKKYIGITVTQYISNSCLSQTTDFSYFYTANYCYCPKD